MKINILATLQDRIPFPRLGEFLDLAAGEEQRPSLQLDYGDTRRDGDPGTPVMRFGNRATLHAIAQAMEKSGEYPGIADVLLKRLQGKPSDIAPDPVLGETPWDELHMEPARGTRMFIGRVAAGEFPQLSKAEREDLTVLDETTTKLNHIPMDMDEELARLVEQESSTQRNMHETEARTPTWTDDRY